MKIAAIRLFNVKRFAGRGVAIENIGDGVNVLTAANEFGKSTSFEALHALFFQQHTGVPKDVRRMQPYSGGNPLVEADIAIQEGRFRLTKQFIGGKRASVVDLDTGRLVAQADEAEAFIARLTRGGNAGPAGLLWVRQGVTDLEDGNGKTAETERRVREDLLSSVQGEVEAITGGRRMAEIMEACAQQLDRLVTRTGRIKADSEYARAHALRQQLADEETRLSAEVAALHEALELRSGLSRRLAELDDKEENAARQAAVDEARGAYEAAKARVEALRAEEAKEALAANMMQTAEEALERFDEAATALRALSGQMDEASRHREALNKSRADAAEASDKALAETEAASEEEAECRDLLDRLDRAMKARQAAEELGALRDTLARAEAARKEIEEARAQLDLIAVPEAKLDQAQEIEAQIAGLRSARDLGRPTLRIAYEENGAGPVTLDGKPLEDGREHSFGQSAELRLPGIGAIHLRSNRPENEDEDLRVAEQALKSLLASLGVASLKEARQRHAEWRDKARAVDRMQDRLEQTAPNGLDALRAEIARRDALQSCQSDVEGDPEDVRAALDAAGRKRVAATRDLKEAQSARDKATDALVAAQSTLTSLQGKLENAEAILGSPETRETRRAALEAELRQKRDAFEDRKAEADALRRENPDIETVLARLKRTESAKRAADDEMGQLREKLAELNGEIRTRSEEAVEEALAETREALATATARMNAFEKEVAVLTKLREELDAARSSARDLYLKPVMSELRPLLGLLFDDASIVFDEKTLLPQTILRNGVEEDVDRLSGGMREQLSILTRLAFARLLSRNGQSAPVILDDALVYSDDDRIERMFDALHRDSSDQQIIVFSCRQRAFARLGGNVLHMTGWQPEGSE